jgi:hypothetical protein
MNFFSFLSFFFFKVSLLKQRLQNGPMNVDAPKPLPPGELQAEVHGDTEKMEGVGEPVGKLLCQSIVQT